MRLLRRLLGAVLTGARRPLVLAGRTEVGEHQRLEEGDLETEQVNVRDEAHTVDSIEVDCRAPYVPPAHPCWCGKETVDHSDPPGSRICFGYPVRHVLGGSTTTQS